MTLEEEFDNEMFNIYKRAKEEADYNAARFLEMLHKERGVRTAKILINAPNVSDGYTALWERERLDLTVEAVIFDNCKWHPLFSEDELKEIKKRLVKYEYPPVLKGGAL